MRKNLWLWQFGGFTFAVALGTVLHFLYEWTGWTFFAAFSAVNESTWEHMKILFFPMLIFAGAQWAFFRGEYEAFWWIKLIGMLVGVGSIPILFYTYNGAFGKSPDWLNIAFFFLAAGLGYFVEWLLFRAEFSLRVPMAAGILLTGIAVAFVVFTFYPPHRPLFQDPVTGVYGIYKIK